MQSYQDVLEDGDLEHGDQWLVFDKEGDAILVACEFCDENNIHYLVDRDGFIYEPSEEELLLPIKNILKGHI